MASTPREVAGFHRAGQPGDYVDEQALALAPRVLGFYTQPGIEPSDFDDSGVMGKVNQDAA